MAVSTIGAVTASSDGTTLTTQPGANTEADWTQLTASSAIACDAIILTMRTVTANGDVLYDLGTGTAGAESVKLADMPGQRQTGSLNQMWTGVYPIAIPASTRIAMRYQASAATTTGRVTGYLIAKDSVEFHECTSSVTYGGTAADSGGISLDPGGSANTLPANYTEITASTSAAHQWWVIGVGNQANTARTDTSWLINIATGAAAAESVIIANLFFCGAAAGDSVSPIFYPPIPVVVPSGTRISAKAQCTITDATDRLIDIVVMGFTGSHASAFSAYMR